MENMSKCNLKDYECEIVLCAGRACGGKVIIKAKTSKEAEEKAFAYVTSKLTQTLPELEIEVEVGKAKARENKTYVVRKR